MASWQIQQAKQKLSEVIRYAKSRGPQRLTDRGKASAWILSDEDYNKLIHPRESLISFFQRSPHRGTELRIERRKDLPRNIDL
jgi:prevent-host-death family protein